MFRQSSFLILTLALVPIPEQQNDDKKSIQGVWIVVSVDGEKENGIIAIFSDREVTVQDRDTRQLSKSTFLLDPNKHPRLIDMKIIESESDKEAIGKTMKGIYDLKGDRLRLCYTEPDRNRPENFATPTLVILERKK